MSKESHTIWECLCDLSQSDPSGVLQAVLTVITALVAAMITVCLGRRQNTLSKQMRDVALLEKRAPIFDSVNEMLTEANELCDLFRDKARYSDGSIEENISRHLEAELDDRLTKFKEAIKQYRKYRLLIGIYFDEEIDNYCEELYRKVKDLFDSVMNMANQGQLEQIRTGALKKRDAIKEFDEYFETQLMEAKALFIKKCSINR